MRLDLLCIVYTYGGTTFITVSFIIRVPLPPRTWAKIRVDHVRTYYVVVFLSHAHLYSEQTVQLGGLAGLDYLQRFPPETLPSTCSGYRVLLFSTTVHATPPSI
jgi:hypothetical protein